MVLSNSSDIFIAVYTLRICLLQLIYPSVHTDELLNGVWFCQYRHYCKCCSYIYITIWVAGL